MAINPHRHIRSRLMRLFILLLIAAIHISASGQPNDKGFVAGSGAKTARHINIPGTRLYIVPPPGFTIATAFAGLKKDDKAVVQVYDLRGGNYYKNAATFSKEAFEAQGGKVFEYKELNLSGFPAKYIFMQGREDAKSIALVFGDTSFSAMIMALYSASDDQTGAEIQKALSTIYYDKSLTVDPFASAAFTLDDSKSSFKFSESSAGVFFYTSREAAKDTAQDPPAALVMSIPRDDTMTGQIIAQMFFDKLKQNGLLEPQIENTSPTTVNGLPAFEVVAYGKIKGQTSLVYQMVITSKDKAVVLQGMAKTDFEKNLKELRKLAAALKLK